MALERNYAQEWFEKEAKADFEDAISKGYASIPQLHKYIEAWQWNSYNDDVRSIFLHNQYSVERVMDRCKAFITCSDLAYHVRYDAEPIKMLLRGVDDTSSYTPDEYEDAVKTGYNSIKKLQQLITVKQWNSCNSKVQSIFVQNSYSAILLMTGNIERNISPVGFLTLSVIGLYEPESLKILIQWVGEVHEYISEGIDFGKLSYIAVHNRKQFEKFLKQRCGVKKLQTSYGLSLQDIYELAAIKSPIVSLGKVLKQITSLSIFQDDVYAKQWIDEHSHVR